MELERWSMYLENNYTILFQCRVLAEINFIAMHMKTDCSTGMLKYAHQNYYNYVFFFHLSLRIPYPLMHGKRIDINVYV